MGGISTSVGIQDGLSSVFQTMTQSINVCLSSFENLHQATGQSMNTAEITAARVALNDVNTAAQQLENQVKDIQPATQRVEAGFKTWQKAIIVANQAVGLIKNTLGSLGVMDMGGAFDRIDTMNRFKKTVTIMTGDANIASTALAQLKDTVLGTAYGLDVASKSTQGFMTRGMSIGAATNQVRVWADAVSFYGEGTNEQLESVVDAIGKMYSKGTVEADQLDRLFDAGIGAAEIYANAVNRTVSEVKEDLSKGVISAQEFLGTVSEALDAGVSAGAAKDAGGSWATTFSNMRAAFTRGWISIIESVDAALASQGLPSSMQMVVGFGKRVEQTMNTVANSMNTVIAVASTLYDIVNTVGGFLYNNWDIISPIIYGVAMAMMFYKGVVVAYNIALGIKNTLTAVAALRDGIYAAKIAMASGATFIQTAAQLGLNAALLACPLTWIILAIIAVIAVIYIVIAVINHFADTSISATGVIIGVFATVAAFIWNTVVGVINAIIQVLWVQFVEPFISIIEWVLNVANGGFDSFGDAVANLVGQIISWFLSLGKVVTKIIDAIFGTNWTSGLNSLQNEVLSWGKNENAITLNRDAPQINSRIAYGDAYNAGYKFGEGVDDKVSNLFSGKDLNVDPTLGAGGDMDTALGNIDNNTANGADSTKKIADSMEITEEDLKYLRDIAEREIIDRTVFQSLRVDMGGVSNTINNRNDFDGIAEYLGDIITTTAQSSMEG